MISRRFKVRSLKSQMRDTQGFTLIELLVVMAILAILFALVLVAVNPVRQTQQANNTQRASDINAIVNAVNQYAADNKGALPSGITTSLKLIGTTLSACDASLCGSETPQANCVDLSGSIAPKYIAAIPHDPTTGNDSNTRYGIKITGVDNRILVRACDAELSQTIQVTQ
ncbi:MAG: type II secretion system protein [Patescibacteria group bacterium]|nr:type II secretion system protein [Patescibacteria group bacterium]